LAPPPAPRGAGGGPRGLGGARGGGAGGGGGRGGGVGAGRRRDDWQRQEGGGHGSDPGEGSVGGRQLRPRQRGCRCPCSAALKHNVNRGGNGGGGGGGRRRGRGTVARTMTSVRPLLLRLSTGRLQASRLHQVMYYDNASGHWHSRTLIHHIRPRRLWRYAGCAPDVHRSSEQAQRCGFCTKL